MRTWSAATARRERGAGTDARGAAPAMDRVPGLREERGEAPHARHDLEAERLLVEAHSLQVAHVEDGVVEAAHGDGYRDKDMLRDRCGSAS